jgi:hypothetical protein
MPRPYSIASYRFDAAMAAQEDRVAEGGDRIVEQQVPSKVAQLTAAATARGGRGSHNAGSRPEYVDRSLIP